MKKNIQKRIYCFDLLKIISILIVIAHHMMMDMYVLHPMHNLKFVEDILVGQKVNIALMSTAMFMLISGATLALKGKEEEPLSFYKKRLIRLLIPFYFAYTIYLIIRIVNAHSIHIFQEIPKWRIIFTFMGMDEYLSANGIRTFTLGVGEWFLGCIILCYLAYPFIYKAHKKAPIVTFLAMTVINVLINKYYGVFNFKIVSYMNFVCQVYNFYIGIVLIDKKVLSKIDKKILLITIPILVLLFAVDIPIYTNMKTTIAITMVFLTFYAFEDIISSIKPLTHLIIFFNMISLEIYLVHHFVIYQVDYMLSYRQMGGFMTLLVICFDLFITIILAMIVERLSRYVTSLMYAGENKRDNNATCRKNSNRKKRHR